MTHVEAFWTLLITWAAAVVWDIIARTVQGASTHKTGVGLVLRIIVPMLAIILTAGLIQAQTPNAILTVAWTAPPDIKPNGDSVQCVQYEIRIDTLPIDSLNCTTGNNILPDSLTPRPKAPGQQETFTFTGLLSERTYYVEIRARDAAGNWATCSNIARKSTPDVRLPERIRDLLFR